MSTTNDGGPAVVITLKDGGTAVISQADAGRVLAHQWRLGTNGYVYRVGGRIAGAQCLLHRFVTRASPGTDVHHLNEDKTDCRRANLSVISPAAHQEHHKHLVLARNFAARVYPLTGQCKACGIEFTKHPDHRGRQTCCSKRCAITLAIDARRKISHEVR